MYLLAAQVANKIAFISVKCVTVSDLLGLIRKPFRAVFALVRKWIVIRWMFVQMFLQLEVGLEAFTAQFACEHELLVLLKENTDRQT